MEKQTNNFKVVLEKNNLNLIELLSSITNYQEMHMEKYVKKHYGNTISKIWNVGNPIGIHCSFYQQKKMEGKRCEEAERWT